MPNIFAFFSKRNAAFLVRLIDAISEWSGRISAWLILCMVLLVCYDVFMRYTFNTTSVALQELEWHLFALTFLLGAAYTLKHDDHVKVDIIYHTRWINPRRKAYLGIIGGLLFLLPFCVLIIYSSYPFVHNAFIQNEGSPDPGGLPYRWLLKAAIPLGFFLLLLQGIADILRNLFLLPGHDMKSTDKEGTD